MHLSPDYSLNTLDANHVGLQTKIYSLLLLAETRAGIEMEANEIHSVSSLAPVIELGVGRDRRDRESKRVFYMQQETAIRCASNICFGNLAHVPHSLTNDYMGTEPSIDDSTEARDAEHWTKVLSHGCYLIDRNSAIRSMLIPILHESTIPFSVLYN